MSLQLLTRPVVSPCARVFLHGHVLASVFLGWPKTTKTILFCCILTDHISNFHVKELCGTRSCRITYSDQNSSRILASRPGICFRIWSASMEALLYKTWYFMVRIRKEALGCLSDYLLSNPRGHLPSSYLVLLLPTSTWNISYKRESGLCLLSQEWETRSKHSETSNTLPVNIRGQQYKERTKDRMERDEQTSKVFHEIDCRKCYFTM